MKKRTVYFLLLFFCSFDLQAKIEVWFLSPPKTAELRLPSFLGTQEFLAENHLDHSKCNPVGESFFHPQYGEHTFGHGPGESQRGQKSGQRDLDTQVEKRSYEYLSHEKTDVISCRKGAYFDMFCGEAKKEGKRKQAQLEVWVDVSSSMRSTDEKWKGSCSRLRFVESLRGGCPKSKISFSVFHTFKKQMGSLPSLCINDGMNDPKRVIKWVRNSKSKHLIILTDISEYSAIFADSLKSLGASFRGHLREDPITSLSLLNHLKFAQALCK